MNIYLAGSCASEDRTMMVQIAKFLRERDNEVYCPWEFKVENAWDLSQEEWAMKVFDADTKAMDHCDLMLVISKGRISSAGTNWEIGYAYGKGIPTHVIQINDEPTSLMVYWGCNNFINLDKEYCGLARELQWVCDHGAIDYHEKCKTVLT